MKRKLLTILGLVSVQLMIAQIDVSMSSTATEIAADGTLNGEITITVSNVPNGSSSVAPNIRVYGQGGNILAGGFLSSTTLPTLDESNADASTTHYDSTTITGSSTFTRTYVIKSWGGPISATAGDVLPIATRFVQGGGLDYTGSTIAAQPQSTNNVVFDLGTLIFSSQPTLSSSNDFSNVDISNSVYPNPVSAGGSIFVNVEGAEVYSVINLAGQTVLKQKATGVLDVSALSAGVYMLRTKAGVAKIVVE